MKKELIQQKAGDSSRKMKKSTNSDKKTSLSKIILNLFLILVFIFLIINFYLFINMINTNMHYNNEFTKLITIYQSSDIPLTIVIPIHNRLSLVNRSLSSVQQQISVKLEIRCVDDCSTEPITEFIIERMKQDRRIKLVQNFYSQGSFHSRKNGVFTAKGQYIVSVDSDDMMLPDSIHPVYNYAVTMNADVVDYVAENRVEGDRIRRSDRRFISKDWKACKENFTNKYDLRLKYINNKLSYNIWKRMVRRSLYIKALSFMSQFAFKKKLIRTEDLFSLGSIFLFTNDMYCTKFPVYVHFMFQKGSVEFGGFQIKEQNKIQSTFTSSVVKYLYLEKSHFEDGNLNDFLSNPLRRENFNKITNIDDSVHLKSCEFDIVGFHHFNISEYGCCVLEKDEGN